MPFALLFDDLMVDMRLHGRRGILMLFGDMLHSPGKGVPLPWPHNDNAVSK